MVKAFEEYIPAAEPNFAESLLNFNNLEEPQKDKLRDTMFHSLISGESPIDIYLTEIPADFGFDVLLTTEIARQREKASENFRQYFSLKLLFGLFSQPPFSTN